VWPDRVRHGMTDDHGLPPEAPQLRGHQARHGTLAASGPHRTNGYDRQDRLELGRLGAQKPEINAGGHGAAGKMHHCLVRDVAVGKDRNVGIELGDRLLEVGFLDHGDAVGIAHPG